MGQVDTDLGPTREEAVGYIDEEGSHEKEEGLSWIASNCREQRKKAEDATTRRVGVDEPGSELVKPNTIHGLSLSRYRAGNSSSVTGLRLRHFTGHEAYFFPFLAIDQAFQGLPQLGRIGLA